MSNSTEKVVCVTGASGYIASWIVKFRLELGYSVRATVRDPSNPNKVDHLLKLDGAKERLHLFEADLMKEGSFDSVVEGCDGVFHTASPVLLGNVKDPQAELIDPAVKGTLNVLQSCAKSPSLKRVVLTSSMAAVLFCDGPRTPEVVVDETWFSDPDFCRESQLWYILSKTLAEDAAWKFVNKNSIDMVAILPSMVGGPLLQPEVNASVEPILNPINGAPFPNASFGWVNVKDVANAHIQAYEIASASGRYCLAERVVHLSGVARILRDLYPTLQISDKCEDNNPYVPTDQVSKEKVEFLGIEFYVPTYQVSTEKAKSLGIEFIPLEVTIKETVESFREKKIVNF